MRVYFEKPRTTVGWKGMINDPDLDGSFNIDKGLRLARNVLARDQQSWPAGGDRILDPRSPQYIADLVAWAAMERAPPKRRFIANWPRPLLPVGFKNGTDGNLRTAVDAVQSAALPGIISWR